MSAWHLPSIHMTLVRNGLISYLGGEAAATKFVNALCKMNAYAIGQRYAKHVKPSKLSKIKDIPNKQALLKMIRCCQYQCAEGNTEIRFAKCWKEMRFVMGQIAIEILDEEIEEDPSAPLPWAIFDQKEVKNFSHCFTKPESV